MSVTEQQRHQLFTWLEETMGSDRAETMMSLLPPVGWADVATKHDLDQLELRLDLRFDAKLNAAILQSTRTFVTWLLPTQAATIGIVAGLILLAELPQEPLSATDVCETW